MNYTVFRMHHHHHNCDWFHWRRWAFRVWSCWVVLRCQICRWLLRSCSSCRMVCWSDANKALWLIRGLKCDENPGPQCQEQFVYLHSFCTVGSSQYFLTWAAILHFFLPQRILTLNIYFIKNTEASLFERRMENWNFIEVFEMSPTFYCMFLLYYFSVKYFTKIL